MLFFKFHNSCQGRQFLLLASQVNKPSHATEHPRNSVNINAQNTFHVAAVTLHTRQNFGTIHRQVFAIYKSSAVTSTQSALHISTVAYLMYQQHNTTAEFCKQMYVLLVG